LEQKLSNKRFWRKGNSFSFLFYLFTKMGSVLKLYTSLEEKLGKETAKVITEAVEELTKEKKNELKMELKEELANELATKRDIYELKLEIEEITRKDIYELKVELEKVRKEIERTKAEMLKWFIGLFVSLVIFLVGWSWTLIKLVLQK